VQKIVFNLKSEDYIIQCFLNKKCNDGIYISCLADEPYVGFLVGYVYYIPNSNIAWIRFAETGPNAPKDEYYITES